MSKHNLDSFASLFVLSSLALASSACTVQTIGGEEPTEAVTAVAIMGTDVPADNDNYLGQLGMLEIQPDSLYVFIGNFDEACGSPLMPVCQQEGPDGETLNQWQVVVGIPASLQQQGVLTLPETGVDGVVAVGGSGSNVGSCGSGPDTLKGEIEIASIDTTQVTLHFMGAQPQIASPEGPPLVMSSSYTASRCPSTGGP